MKKDRPYQIAYEFFAFIIFLVITIGVAEYLDYKCIVQFRPIIEGDYNHFGQKCPNK